MAALPEENVQDYPRPPALVPVPQEVRVVFAGQTIAASTGALRVLETHHAPTYYIPAADWAAGVLRPAPRARGTVCEWKGRAVYYDVSVLGETASAAAWRYPDPTPDFAALAGAFAVYASAMESCWVGPERVVPQPGDFYGGWVTGNLRGIVKGAPGTEGW